MIKYKKLPNNIMHLMIKAEIYLNDRSDISFAYLFGSLANGKPKPLSDVDIAIFFSNNEDLLEKKMEVLGDLMELLETDEIDLIVLNTAPLTLKKRILENKKIIVDKEPFFRNNYESLVLRKYFDFAIKEMDILKRRYFYG